MVKKAGQLAATPVSKTRPHPACLDGESGCEASSFSCSSRPASFTTSTSEVGSQGASSPVFLAVQPDSPPGRARWGLPADPDSRGEGGVQPRSLAMSQIAPGRYFASLPASTGVYWLERGNPPRRQAAAKRPRRGSGAFHAGDDPQARWRRGNGRKAGRADGPPLALAAGRGGRPARARSGRSADGEAIRFADQNLGRCTPLR